MNRILIVDDKPDNRYLLHALLKGHGCEVDEACHGAEALVRARQTSPDLVISDLLMPVMDGYTLLRHWKLDDRLKQIPFIVYTATYTEPKDEQLALDLGADDFIVKPAEPEPFMVRIREVLARQRKGELSPSKFPKDEDRVLLRQYNEVLVRRLEIKMEQLQQANHELEREINALKRAEQKIVNLAAIVESSDDAIVGKTIEGIITSWNKGAERLYGFTEGEIIGKPISMLVPPGHEDEIPLILAKIRRREHVQHYETERRRKTGELVQVSLTISPIEDLEGQIIGASTIARDITARKRTEKCIRKISSLQTALHEPGALHEKLKRITDGAVNIFDVEVARIWLMGPGDLCNLGCMHAGVVEGPHVCRHRDKCLHLVASSGRYTRLDGKAHGRVPFGCYKIGLIASGEADGFLTNDVTNDPRVHNREWAKSLGLVSFAGYQLRHPHSGTMGVLALFARHPITSEEDALLRSFSNLIVPVIRTAQAEEELRKLNAELEQRVGERTAQLEAANKELEAFSYSVSHDLHAPLRAINGFSNMLVEEGAKQLDEEGRRIVDVIRAETKRMGQLIDDLLAFSRIGRQDMQSVEVDMGALAQTVFDACAAQAPGRKLQFKLHPLPPAHGDKNLLRQVWVNLISNAVKYTRPMDAAKIEITGHAGDRELHYSVKDNGAGFDMKNAHKLFRVFQRLHSEDEFEGTGVGLALVQRIVQRHGGRIWAEGKVNEGATFHFTLPVNR